MGSDEKWGVVYDGSSTWSLGPAEDPQCGDWHASILVRGEEAEEHWRRIYPRIVRVPEMEREILSLRSRLAEREARLAEFVAQVEEFRTWDAADWPAAFATLQRLASAALAKTPLPGGETEK